MLGFDMLMRVDEDGGIEVVLETGIDLAKVAAAADLMVEAERRESRWTLGVDADAETRRYLSLDSTLNPSPIDFLARPRP